MKATELRNGLGVKIDGKLAVLTQVEHRTPGNLRAFIQIKYKDILKPLHINQDLARYELDLEQTASERERIRRERPGWIAEDAEQVAARYRAGELDVYDLVRQYGVILDWGTGELLPNTTRVFREMLQRRSVEHWEQPKEPAREAR